MSRVQLASSVDLDEAAPFSSKPFDTAPAKVRPCYGNFATRTDPHVPTP